MPAQDSLLRLQGVSGTFAGRRFPMADTVRIGRDPSLNQLSYPANVKGISRQHCELRLVNGQVYLKDLGSTYGTFLGSGQRLARQPARAAQARRPLQPGFAPRNLRLAPQGRGIGWHSVPTAAIPAREGSVPSAAMR